MNQTFRSRLRAALLPALCAAAGTSAHAAFTNLNLGPLLIPNGYVTFAFDQIPDGRLVYGTQNALSYQTNFGGTEIAPVPAAGEYFDPSSVKAYSDTLGVVGGYNTIYTYNPTSGSSTLTALPNVSLQSYSLAFRDSVSLYVGGANATGLNPAFGPFPATHKHAISYVPLSGATPKLLIDNISDYSGDFTIDMDGNLYVTDNDFNNMKVYKFSKSLLEPVVRGKRAALQLSDGQAIATLADTSSVAIDSRGLIYCAGYLNAGITVYDPATQTTTTYTPAGANTNYQVATFTRLGQEYISYFDAVPTPNNTPTTDDDFAAYYGYDLVQNIPEPTGSFLLAAGVLVWATRRRHVART